MCRLLGIYGKVDFWPEIVNAFRELAQTGRVPPVKDILPGHKDGWGMAKSNQDQTAMVPIAKQMGSAADSNLFTESVDTLLPTRILMCHLRKASSSVVVTLANVHPFYSGRWAFMHNGFISSAEKLPGDNSLSPTSEGSDSEYFFHHLLTLVSQRPGQQGEAETIYNACRYLPEDFTSLNNLMSDGRQLFCARWHATHENYYTLYTYRLADAAIICSEPLVSDSLQPENWEELPNRTVLRIHGSPPEIELYGPAAV
jgi:predicted glutamine amidotransferase